MRTGCGLDTARLDSERDGRNAAEVINRVFRKRGSATSVYAGPDALHVLGFGRGGEAARATYGWSAAGLDRLASALGEAYRAELKARRAPDPAGMLAALGADLGHALRSLAATDRVSHCEPRQHAQEASADAEEDEEDTED